MKKKLFLYTAIILTFTLIGYFLINYLIDRNQELNSSYKLNNQVIDYSMFNNRKKTMSTKDVLNNRLNNLNCLPKSRLSTDPGPPGV